VCHGFSDIKITATTKEKEKLKIFVQHNWKSPSFIRKLLAQKKGKNQNKK
jgi:hypothetical protein